MAYQAVTIGLVLASGIAALVTFLSTQDSLKKAQSRFYQDARFADVFAELKRAPLSLERQISQIPGVVSLESRIVKDFLLRLPDQMEAAVGRFISVPESGSPKLNGLYLRKGRMLDPQRSDEVLISEGFAEANHMEPGSSIGAIVNGKYKTFKVVGTVLSPEYIYAIRGETPVPNDRLFGIFWTSRKGLESALDMDGSFNSISLILGPGSSERMVIDHLDRLLEDYGGLGAYSRENQVSHQFLSDEMSQLKVMAVAIPLIFLWVAAFLFHVVLERMIGTQRSQIATLKAVGYSNFSISMHYLKLVVWIVFFGLLAGFAVGVWLGRAYTQLYTDFYRFPIMIYSVGPGLFLVALLVGFGSGFLGIYSALRKVFRLNPAEAMRPPAPPAFHENIWEKLGLTRRLSRRGRILFRNLTLRPWRTTLSVMGIAFAVMVTMLGLFWWDTVNFIIFTQFSLTQREDAQIVFVENVPEKTLEELGNIPGVLQVEGYRGLPIRMKLGHRKIQTSLTGYPPNAQLRRLLNKDWKDVELPPEGLLISQLLAKKLKAHSGDTVEVEVLEGKRQKWRLNVSGIVDQWLGYGSYMDLAALQRLVGDKEINSAGIMVDFSKEPSIQRTFKNLPMVGAVNFKYVILNMFQSTMINFILVFATALTGFALVIAVGVVYNNARIALSERVWELMSLRVLGFTRQEVFTILGGEMLLQVLAALPVGWLFGYLFSALMVRLMQTETFDIPLVIETHTFAYASMVVLFSAAVSSWIIRRRLDKTDLVAALKVRE